MKTKTMPSLSAGFTLIELLVVIAIVGILSSVVLSSVQTARHKAANASVKTSLRSIIAAADVIYDGTNSYNTICTNPDINKTYTAAGAAGGGFGVCNHSSTQWAASAPLKEAEGTSIYWCVDSTGLLKGTSIPLGTARVCP